MKRSIEVFSVRGLRMRSSEPDKDLALALFEQGLVTLAKAARLAGVTLDVFMDMVAEAGLVAVDYPPEELADELRVEIRSRRSRDEAGSHGVRANR